MPQDLLTLKILADELNGILLNSKVQKVNMPERDEVRLSLFNGKNRTLVISCNPNTSRIHLTEEKKENPYTAPAFCMLLRKHLLGGVLEDISIFNNDRIFSLKFLTHNEMQDTERVYLYVELMGRYSNIILVNSDSKIIDSIVHIGLSENGRRIIMPSVTYTPEKKGDKAELEDEEKIKLNLQNTEKTDLFDALLSSVNGLSKQSAKEIAMRSNNDIKNVDKVLSQITYFNNILKENSLKPCVLSDYSDFFVTPYLSISDENNYIFFPTLNDAVNAVFSKKDKAERTKNIYKETIDKTKKYRDKLVKKIDIARAKLLECDGMENVRISAELLSNNLYKIKRGDKEIVVDNYYDEMHPFIISLDVTKSPQQNVQTLYNKYNKLKRAKDISEKQLSDYTKTLEYVETILDALSRAEITDAENINEELINLGIIRREKSSSRKKQDVKIPPKTFIMDGYIIYIGTNNIQNNEVTFKIGRSYDLWLHVKNQHGSHCIIRKNNEDDIIPDEVILASAELASYYSSARDSLNVAVDYCERKFVHRIKDAGIGMVTYDNYKTVFVNPQNHLK